MPIYDWRCLVCGEVVRDVLHLADLGSCDKCNSKSWTRLPPIPNVKVKDGTPKFYSREGRTR